MTRRSNPTPNIPSSAEIRAESQRMQKNARRRRIVCLVVGIVILIAAIVLLLVTLALRQPVREEKAAAHAVPEEETPRNETVSSAGAESRSEEISYPDSVDASKLTLSETETEITAENAEEESEASVSGTVEVKTYLNLRSGGSLDNEIIGHLLPEDEVTVIEEEDGWYKVITSEIVGYVCGDYLEVEDISDDSE